MAKKRGQNEGTIFKRKDKDIWVAQISIQGKRISKYGKTQSECREWIRKMQNQVDDGLTIAGAQKTLAKYLEEWLLVHATSIRPKTAEQYNQICKQHIIPNLGSIKLKDLQAGHIQSLYSKKLASGTSKRTVVLIHAVLMRSLKQAEKMGIIGKNPVLAVTRPKVERKEMKVLNDGQVRSLLSAAAGERYEAAFWLAVSTGMRLGELVGLKWADIEWTNKQLRVQRQVQRLSTGLAFSEPKTKTSRRMIALGSEPVEKLRKHLVSQSKDRQKAGESWIENDLIFPSVIGTPLDPSNLYHIFKELLKKAQLPPIRFHDLRHTAATLMLLQGTHPKIVQERLGHSDISMTLNTYSHVIPSMQAEAAEKLDELLMPISVSDEIKQLKERGADHISHGDYFIIENA